MPTIVDILIQGKKGQAGDARWFKCYTDPKRCKLVVEFIKTIANIAKENHQPHQITRVITDEFSFYPRSGPFTLNEYKEIIGQIAEIAKDLPPDVHLVLATFPVLWIHEPVFNCGLYVQAPLEAGQTATIHHFQKQKPSTKDIRYSPENVPFGVDYPLSGGPDYKHDHPNLVLQDTAVSTNDPRQYDSALKITTSEGQSFIVSVGICLDHIKGVEREKVHALIDRLAESGESIPLHCSHVITSYSSAEFPENILSTVTHADPHAGCRQPDKYPRRKNFLPISFLSPYSNTELTAEIYPAKLIGTLHSDLFQHIVVNQSSESLTLYLNEPDKTGKTRLHRVFLETDYDHELIAKRLYALILNGANPDIKEAEGKSVRELAQSPIVTKAIASALLWRAKIALNNHLSRGDGYTALTRLLRNKTGVTREKIYALILNGSNPYQKDREGKNALEIISDYPDDDTDESMPKILRRFINEAFKLTQYGNFANFQNCYNPQVEFIPQQNSWFAPPPALAKDEISPDLLKAIRIKRWDIVSIMMTPTTPNFLNFKSRELVLFKAAEQGLAQLLSEIPFEMLKESLLTKNSKGLTPIHLFYKALISSKSDEALKQTNFSQLLYEVCLESNKTEYCDQYQDFIINCLTLLAEEAKYPEAWMALALIAFTQKAIPAMVGTVPGIVTSETYISRIEDRFISSTASDSQSSHFSFFSRKEIPRIQEEIYFGLLFAAPESITRNAEDTRNVKQFIQSYQATMQKVLGILPRAPEPTPSPS